jgi:hypothetical protein
MGITTTATMSIKLSGTITAQSTVIGGAIIPLYTYPTDPTWTTIVNIKDAHPKVPIVAIVNPNSGPGSVQDINFVNGINKLMVHGISVIGYAATGYGSVPLPYMKREINLYHSWYNVGGILFDEMNNVTGYENYYRTLSNYAMSLGLTITVGNPGADIPPTYVGTVDTILIYENQGLPDLSYIDGWHSCYGRNNWGITSYGNPQLNQRYVFNAKQYVGYIYITNDVLPNPYDALPPYFGTLVAELDQNNGASGIAQSRIQI